MNHFSDETEAPATPFDRVFDLINEAHTASPLGRSNAFREIKTTLAAMKAPELRALALDMASQILTLAKDAR